MTIAFEDFMNVDIRVGTVTDVQDFPEARNPAYKVFVDFGEDIGQKKSSVQITKNYNKEDLVGKQVMAVVNFAPRQIGPFMSEILVLGVPDENEEVVLLQPSQNVPNGGRLY